MRLRELINRAVKPRLSDRFGELRVELEDDPNITEDDVQFDENEETVSIAGLSLVLEYENSKRELSQRLVTCRQFSINAGKSYLKAYCHHRTALRTFRLDRVKDVFDAKTGESLSPVQAFFAQFSPDKMTKSGLTWGLSVGQRADLVALLNALVFLARCDREFHPSEAQCLESALTSFWIRMEILGNPDFTEILDYADRLAPDGETFWIAMHRFRENDVLARVFRAQAQALIEADGVIREEEAYWSLEIEEFLSDD